MNLSAQDGHVDRVRRSPDFSAGDGHMVPGRVDEEEAGDAGRRDSRGLPMFGPRPPSGDDDGAGNRSDSSGSSPRYRKLDRQISSSSSFQAAEEAEVARVRSIESRKRDSLAIVGRPVATDAQLHRQGSSFKASQEAEIARVRSVESGKRDSVMLAHERIDANAGDRHREAEESIPTDSHPVATGASSEQQPGYRGAAVSHPIIAADEKDDSWLADWQADANQGRGVQLEGGTHDDTKLPPHPWKMSHSDAIGSASSQRNQEDGARHEQSEQGLGKNTERSFKEKFSGSMLTLFGLGQSEKTGRTPGSRGANAGDTPSSSNFQSLFSFKSPKYVGQEAQIAVEAAEGSAGAAQTERQTSQATLKQIFDLVAEQIMSQKDSAQVAEWENLFVTISGSRDQAINVSSDLGETLMRLGINIHMSTLHETICEVCQSRGREPDGYHGTGVSLRIPVYHELSVEEFVGVMRVLTKKTQRDDKLLQARQIFTM